MTLLLTSFAPWKAHQATNASDDLIDWLIVRNQLPKNAVVMRHLPVHFQLAPSQVLAMLMKQRPAVVVCCGMAEQRPLLNLERYARHQGGCLETSLNLQWLRAGTQWTDVSHDAGNYVCNELYYQLLAHIQKHRWPIQGLFIHVPVLTAYNRELILQDFTLMLTRLSVAKTVRTCRSLSFENYERGPTQVVSASKKVSLSKTS